jgi:hypothetical protein
MGEKASIFQGVQVGIQTLAGTGVDADLKLLSVSVVPQPRTEADQFRPMGSKYPSFVTLSKEWSELAIEGKLTYNEIVYLLSSFLSAPTPVQQGATTAYKWTFVSDTDGEDDGELLTIQQGDANNAWEVIDGRVNGLTFTFNRSGANVNGSGIAGKLDTTATLTVSPTSLTPLPILAGHLSFKMADTQAGLAGATALTRGFSMEFSLTDKSGLAWPVGQEPVPVETTPNIQAKLKLATDTVGMGLIATMRAGTTKWFRIKGTGALIEDTYYNDFQLDFPAQIEAPGDMSDQEGLYALEYSLIPIHDSTWGKAFQIDIINAVTAL